MSEDLGEGPYEQQALEESFLKAIEAMGAGRGDDAEALLRQVLAGDPRLPEPRLELAVLLYRRGALEEAEAQARMGVDQVERGWQWLENFEEGQLHAHALNVLGEIILASFGEDGAVASESAPERWREAERLFKRAVELDPDNGDAHSNLAGFRRRRPTARA